MANNIDPIGAVLMFGDDIIDKLNKVDSEFKKIEDHSATFAKNISAAFNNVSGVNGFSNRINEIRNSFNQLGNLKSLSTLNNAIEKSVSETTKLVVEANAARDSYRQVAEAMAKANTANLKVGRDKATFSDENIGMIEKRVEKLTSALEKGKAMWTKASLEAENAQRQLMGKTLLKESNIGTLVGAKSNSLTPQLQQEYINERAYWNERLQFLRMSEQQRAELAVQGAQKVLEAERKMAEAVYQTDLGMLNKQMQLTNKIKELMANPNLTANESKLLIEYQAELERTKTILGELTKRYPELHAEAKKAFRITELEEAIQYEKRLEDAVRRRMQAQASPSEAMAFSANANTIAKRQQAIQYLQTAINNINQSESKYISTVMKLSAEMRRQQTEINKVTAAQFSLGKQHTSLINLSGQLRGMISMTFSIYQIQNFIKKMTQVRGEFEMQHTALRAIIQDFDEADKLWGQITQLAVESPFRVKELVTYTKQLAAYRIETDKIFDVTKRLADVSSGLGVDMQRLILAYGQVKAANYLRGQELRQFSEAGINILGELASKFSEVEGRTVSVGEVFDMVSKRMVKFEDVADIFERITNEGGIFYEMQKKQADTLKGRISNLKDSLDLMFDSIGKANQGILKESVNMLKNIADNWREVSVAVIPIVNAALTAWAGNSIIKALSRGGAIQKLFIVTFPTIIKNIKTLLYAIGSAPVVFNRATSATFKYATAVKAGGSAIAGLSSVLTVLVAVMTAVALAYNNATRIQREMNSIMSEGVNSAAESSDRFVRLAEAATDGSKSYDEQQRALKKLKDAYKDILPSHMLEVESLKQMSDGYKEATAAITEYTIAKAKEKQLDFLGNEMANDKSLSTKKIEGVLREKGIKLDSSEISYIKNEIDKAFLEDGKLKWDDFVKKFNDVASEITGKTVDIAQGFVPQELLKYWKNMNKYSDEMENVYSNMNNSFVSSRELRDALNDIDKETANIIGNINSEKSTSVINEWVNGAKQLVSTIPELSKLPETASEHEKNLSKTADFIRSIGDEGMRIEDILANPILKEELEREIKSVEILRQRDKLLNGIGDKTGTEVEWTKKSIETLDKTFDNSILDKRGRAVQEFILDYSEASKVPIEELSKYMMRADEETKEFVKRLKADQDDIKDNMYGYKNGASSIITGIWNDEEYNQKSELDKFLTSLRNFLNDFDKTQKGGSGSGKKDKIPERISLIRDMNKEYEKLIENYSKEEAHEKVMESFKDSWNEIMGGKYAMDDFFMSGDGVVRKLEELKPEAVAEKTIGKLEKAISDENVEIGIDVRVKNRDLFKKDIENMFSELDINEEIEKLGIPKALAEELFGLESVNLEDIRRKIMSEKEKQNGAFVGSEGTKLYMEYLDKIDGMEQKQQTERLKSYVKYLREAMEERVKIEYEGLKEINDINKLYESGRIGENERDVMIEGSRKATSEKMQKQVWEDFKGSDTYIKLFQDLDSQSSKALEHMRKKLKEMGDSMHDLNPTDLRNLQEQIEKLDDEINKRHPLKALIESIKEVKALDSRDSLVGKLIGGEDEESRLQAIVDKLQVAQQMMMNGADGMDVDRKIAEIFPSNIDTTYGNMVDSTNLELVLKMYLELLKAQKEENNNTKTQINSWDELVDSARTYATEWKKAFDTVKSAGGDVFSMVEALGGANDEADKAFMDVFNAIIDIIAIIPTYVAGMTAAGVAINSAMGIIGLVAEAITLITGLVTAISKLHDAKIEDEINGIRDEVDGLTGAYEDLEREMDRAWDLSKMRAKSEEMRYNLQMQIDATERMMAAERKKKDSDEEQLKSWNQDIKDLTLQLQDERQRFIEESGGIGETNYLSAAEEYTSAWLEAFRETGDGLTGLEEHWNEYFDNLIKRQLTLQFAKASLGKLFEQVDNALGDGDLSTEEAEAIDKLKNEALADFNEKMKMAAAQFGWGDSSESALSDLTESIQGMSEQEAEVIAGYLNSVRFFTGDSNAAIRSLTDALLSSSDGANPILDELRRQTAMITAIRDALTATVTDGMSRGKGIRVYMQ